MSRFSLRSPSSTSRWLVAMLVTAASLLAPPRRIAADVIVLLEPPLVRKFPAFDFCPFPLEMEFTATGSTAKIFVSANVYVSNGSEMKYTHQAIDNIVVVRDSVYALHLDANTETNYFHSCYCSTPATPGCAPGATVPFIFKFDQLDPGDAPYTPYTELFESNSGGWDVTNGAYYDNSRSGPMNPSSGSGGSPTSGTGCLGLGASSVTPSLADTARTMIAIGGLIGSKRYVLTGWWSVDNGIDTDDVSLTFVITGPNQTPLARKTWGNLKARYR